MYPDNQYTILRVDAIVLEKIIYLHHLINGFWSDTTNGIRNVYVYTDTRARHSHGLVDAHIYIAYYISRTIHITSSSLSFSSSYCSFYSSICVCPCVRECLCVYCFQNDTREGGQAETALKDDS